MFVRLLAATATTLLPPLIGGVAGALLGGDDVALASGLCAAGICLGGAIGALLRRRFIALPPRVGRFNTQLASVVLACGAAAMVSAAVWLTWRGPQTLTQGATPRSAEYVELRGTPHLRYIYKSSQALYRFPLREHDAHILVETDRRPDGAAQRFRGSLAPSLVGGLMDKDKGYFAGSYARQRKLRGTIYLLKVSRVLSPSILTWAGGGLLGLLALAAFYRRALRDT